MFPHNVNLIIPVSSFAETSFLSTDLDEYFNIVGTVQLVDYQLSHIRVMRQHLQPFSLFKTVATVTTRILLDRDQAHLGSRQIYITFGCSQILNTFEKGHVFLLNNRHLLNQSMP